MKWPLYPRLFDIDIALALNLASFLLKIVERIAAALADHFCNTYVCTTLHNYIILDKAAV